MSPERLAIQLPRPVAALILLTPVMLTAIYLAFGLEVYLSVLSVLAVLIAVVAIGATVFMVGLTLEENEVARANGYPLGWRRLTLTRVMTYGVVTCQAFALYIGVLAGVRLAGGAPIEWTPPITATVFVALECVPLLFAGYLRLLRQRRQARNGRAAPPPFDKED